MMQHRNQTGGYLDDAYSPYVSPSHNNLGKGPNESNNRKNVSRRSSSAADQAPIYGTGVSNMHYIEAGYPRVPRWANWRSPYPNHNGAPPYAS